MIYFVSTIFTRFSRHTYIPRVASKTTQAILASCGAYHAMKGIKVMAGLYGNKKTFVRGNFEEAVLSVFNWSLRDKTLGKHKYPGQNMDSAGIIF